MSDKTMVALEHFSKTTSAVWYHKPASKVPSSDPDLILLLGWMDATPRHISKYTAGYEKLYPNARILAVMTTYRDTAFRTWSANEDRVKPVLDMLHTLEQNEKVLLHLFSDGGAFTVSLIANAYRATKGLPMPVTATVLDSSPGRTRFSATIASFSIGLPKNVILYTLGIFVFHVGYICYMTAYTLSGKPNLIEQGRRNLNNKKLFDTDAPRMYIYSETDAITDWRDIEEHMEEGKMLGYAVGNQKFLRSGHTAHMLEDPERYWDIVRKHWESVS